MVIFEDSETHKSKTFDDFPSSQSVFELCDPKVPKFLKNKPLLYVVEISDLYLFVDYRIFYRGRKV